MKFITHFWVGSFLVFLTFLTPSTKSGLISAPIEAEELKSINGELDTRDGPFHKEISPGEATRKFREKRGLLGLQETLLDLGMNGGGGGDPLLNSRKRQRPFQRPLRPRPLPPPSRPSFGMGSPGMCRPYSCVNHCPRDCDSLCSVNGQCFCSCPEDEVFYEYYDTPNYNTESIQFY